MTTAPCQWAKKKVAGMRNQAQKSKMVSVNSWSLERKRGRTTIPLLSLLSISSALATDTQDWISLWHSITMPKGFKLWRRPCVLIYMRSQASVKKILFVGFWSWTQAQIIGYGLIIDLLCASVLQSILKFCVFIAWAILISYNLGSLFIVSSIDPTLTLILTDEWVGPGQEVVNKC